MSASIDCKMAKSLVFKTGMQAVRFIPRMTENLNGVQPKLTIEEERLTDDQIVAAILGGDDSGYKELMDRHSQRVFAIVGLLF